LWKDEIHGISSQLREKERKKKGKIEERNKRNDGLH
jgi:hypothetical protein